jgi:tetratricopeptide (TPR) repeat protein
MEDDVVEICAAAKEHCVRGTSRFAQGDFAGALGDFDRALEIDGDYSEAWNNRGAAHLALGNRAAAVSDFDRALKLRPRYAEAYNNRGIARQAMADDARALADFDRALEIEPVYVEALRNRGAVRYALGDWAGSIQDFDRALAICPNDPDTIFRRGSARQARGDLHGAVDDFTRVLALRPHQAAAPVYHDRGVARIALREFAAAVADFDQAIAIDPAYCIAYISRGNARYHLRNPGGLDDYMTAFRIDPERSASEIIRILTVGLQEDPEGVLENCRQHVRICPDDIVAYARRGLTLLLQDKDDQAALDFDQILRRRPDWEANLKRLIDTARRQRAARRSGSAMG